MATIVKKTEVKYHSQPVKFPMELVALIDWYKERMHLNSRNNAVNDIVSRFFNQRDGISPAVEAMVKSELERMEPAKIVEAMLAASNADDVVDTLLAHMRPHLLASIQSGYSAIAALQPKGIKEK